MKLTTRVLGLSLVSLSILLIILLGSVKVNSDVQSAALCELTYEAGIPMEQCPAHQNPNSWFLIVAFGVAFVILGAGAYLSLPSRAIQTSKSFKKINLGILDEEEKVIYNFIKEKEGSVYQSDIIKSTEFSKVRVSRILDRMENKDLLERKRRGMTNIVVLK